MEAESRRRALAVVGLALVALSALMVVLLVNVERRAIFPAPPPDGVVPPPGGGAEVVSLGPWGSSAEALFLPPLAGEGRAPLIVFFHGNAELADHWIGPFEEPRRRGWAALLVEYPGYGRCAGSPSEGAVVAAALAAYDWARTDSRVDTARIVAYGRSLGGGAATALAARRRVAALVLESSFTSIPDVAGLRGPARWLVFDRFDNLAELKRWHGPLLVLHGRRDDVIPFELGTRLAAAVPGARFVEMPCGHNDCPRPWDTVLAFLDGAGAAPTTPAD